MKRLICAGLVISFAVSGICGCTPKEKEKTVITVLAAASLTDVCGELETMYENSHENIDLVFSFAGSGALQSQIEEGADADVFISAANAQMNVLVDEGLMDNSTVIPLLENKVVLIVPSGSDLSLDSFEDVTVPEVSMIGLGEVESVPAGKYASEIFTSLGIWEEVESRANFGSDVRTVLTWVEEGEVSCGVVYATDAYGSDRVTIVAEAPEGSCDPVIYPVGVVAASSHPDEARAFEDFLQSPEAMEVFIGYGFTEAR